MASVAIGVEVHVGGVRAVHLYKGRKGPALGGTGFAALPADVIGHDGVREPSSYAAAVMQALDQAGAKRRANVCVSITSELIDIRRLRLPRMPERDLNQTIRRELERLIRFDDEMLFDHHVVAEYDDSNMLDLVVVAAPRGLVHSYLRPLQAAGCHPEILDVGGLALPWALPRGGDVGYVALGPETVHVLFCANGQYHTSRLFPLSLGGLLEVAGAGEAVTLKDIEHLDSGLSASLRQTLDELSRTLVQTLEGAQGLQGIDQLVVSGEGALVGAIDGWIEEALGVTTLLADPVVGPEHHGALGADAPALAVAVGLAHRGLDEL